MSCPKFDLREHIKKYRGGQLIRASDFNWWQINVLREFISRTCLLHGERSVAYASHGNCEVVRPTDPPSMNVEYEIVAVYINGERIELSPHLSGTLSISPNNSKHPRIDLVYYDYDEITNTHIVDVVEGTPALDPELPELPTETATPVASILVKPNITQIEEKHINNVYFPFIWFLIQKREMLKDYIVTNTNFMFSNRWDIHYQEGYEFPFLRKTWDDTFETSSKIDSTRSYNIEQSNLEDGHIRLGTNPTQPTITLQEAKVVFHRCFTRVKDYYCVVQQGVQEKGEHAEHPDFYRKYSKPFLNIYDTDWNLVNTVDLYELFKAFDFSQLFEYDYIAYDSQSAEEPSLLQPFILMDAYYSDIQKGHHEGGKHFIIRYGCEQVDFWNGKRVATLPFYWDEECPEIAQDMGNILYLITEKSEDPEEFVETKINVSLNLVECQGGYPKTCVEIYCGCQTGGDWNNDNITFVSKIASKSSPYRRINDFSVAHPGFTGDLFGGKLSSRDPFFVLKNWFESNYPNKSFIDEFTKYKDWLTQRDNRHYYFELKIIDEGDLTQGDIPVVHYEIRGIESIPNTNKVVFYLSSYRNNFYKKAEDVHYYFNDVIAIYDIDTQLIEFFVLNGANMVEDVYAIYEKDGKYYIFISYYTEHNLQYSGRPMITDKTKRYHTKLLVLDGGEITEYDLEDVPLILPTENILLAVVRKGIISYRHCSQTYHLDQYSYCFIDWTKFLSSLPNVKSSALAGEFAKDYNVVVKGLPFTKNEETYFLLVERWRYVHDVIDGAIINPIDYIWQNMNEIMKDKEMSVLNSIGNIVARVHISKSMDKSVKIKGCTPLNVFSEFEIYWGDIVHIGKGVFAISRSLPPFERVHINKTIEIIVWDIPEPYVCGTGTPRFKLFVRKGGLLIYKIREDFPVEFLDAEFEQINKIFVPSPLEHKYTTIVIFDALDVGSYFLEGEYWSEEIDVTKFTVAGQSGESTTNDSLILVARDKIPDGCDIQYFVSEFPYLTKRLIEKDTLINFDSSIQRIKVGAILTSDGYSTPKIYDIGVLYGTRQIDIFKKRELG